MPYSQWYIDEFRDTLKVPLKASDGLSDPEVDDMCSNRLIPQAMRDYFRVAGRHWLNTNHNQLRAVSNFEVVDDYTIFMDENQVVVQWAIRNSEMADDDPTVYLGQQLDAGYEWYAEEYSFSRFIIATWQWTLTGEDPE